MFVGEKGLCSGKVGVVASCCSWVGRRVGGWVGRYVSYGVLI